MPWRDAKSVPFSCIHVAAHVPSSAGVYAVQEGETTLLVGESWNLKARLLELANALTQLENVRVTFELCAEDKLAERKSELTRELSAIPEAGEPELKRLPGISLRDSPNRQNL